jgi:hypothetical protein
MSSGRFRRLRAMAPCPGWSSCARGQDPGAAAARSPWSPQLGNEHRHDRQAAELLGSRLAEGSRGLAYRQRRPSRPVRRKSFAVGRTSRARLEHVGGEIACCWWYELLRARPLVSPRLMP